MGAHAVLRALSNVADLPVGMLIEYIEHLDLLKLLSQIFIDESLNAEGARNSNLNLHPWPYQPELFELTLGSSSASVVQHPRPPRALYYMCSYQLSLRPHRRIPFRPQSCIGKWAVMGEQFDANAGAREGEGFR
jgi:hypothetical protein